MKNTLLFTFSLLVLGLSAFAQPNPGGGVAPIISEIMYNPPESGTDSLEFIEIMNPSLASPMDLSGFYFSAGVEYTFPTGSIVPPSGFVVVAVDSVAFADVFGYPALEWTSGGLNNGGEGITLRSAAGIVADTVFYDDSGDWPSEADQGGYSLVLCDPTMDNNVGTNWSISTNDVGFFSNGMDTYADPYQFIACTTVGIADDNVITTLIYPNPSNGEFRIQFETLSSVGTVSIYNQVGQLVHSEKIAVGASSIQVNATLKTGQYILLLESEGVAERRKLTIN